MTNIYANGGIDHPPPNEPAATHHSDDGQPAQTQSAAGEKQEAPSSTSSAQSSAPKAGADPATLVVNGRDTIGDRIDFIYAKTDRYVIYSAAGQVRFVLLMDYEAAKDLRSRIEPLGGLRISIEDLRAEGSISELDRSRAGRELAWALGEAFEDTGEPLSDQPKAILEQVDARLRAILKGQCRKRYVFANLTAFAFIEAFLAITAFTLHSTVPLLHYAEFGLVGALGAFLSVIAGIKSIDFDIDLKPWEHVFAGTTRIMIGVIGGWVVALALDSALIDPTFGNRTTDAQNPSVYNIPTRDAMYLILTLIGGFSETFVPNLLRRGEDAAGAAKGQSTDAPIVKDP